MRKFIPMLTLVLILNVIAPVIAASNVNLEGNLSTKVQVTPKSPVDTGISAKSDLDLELSMKMKNGNQVQGYIGLELAEGDLSKNEGKDIGLDEISYQSLTPRPLNLVDGLIIKKLYLETTGAFSQDGPVFITRLGDLEIDYSPYIAHISKTDGIIEGIQMSGLHLGPVEIASFYGWAIRPVKNDEGVEHVRFADFGVHGKSELLGIALEGSALKTGDDIAFSGNVQFAPILGVDLVGTAAWDSLGNATVVKAEAGIGEILFSSKTRGKVILRSFDPLFNPVYRDDRKNEDTDEDINVIDINAGKRGIAGEIHTQLMGTKITGKADWHEQRDINRDIVGTRTQFGLSANGMYEGFNIRAGFNNIWSSVDTPYAILDRNEDADPRIETRITAGVGGYIPIGHLVVDTNYDLELSTIGSGISGVHKISASTNADFPMFSNVGLSGNLRCDKDGITYMGKMAYIAPSGIEMIASYNSGYTTKKAEGFSLSAGIGVGF